MERFEPSVSDSEIHALWKTIDREFTKLRNADTPEVRVNFTRNGDILVICGIARYDYLALYQNIGEGEDYCALLESRSGDESTMIGMIIGPQELTINGITRHTEATSRLRHACETVEWNPWISSTHADKVIEAQIVSASRSFRATPRTPLV